MGAWALLALQVIAPWTMPAQASWPITTEMPVKVEVHASSASMAGRAPIDVMLTALTSDVQISPFLQPTRGIAFRVKTVANDPVTSAEPMIGSPPPPPLDPSKLTPIPVGQPLVVHTNEQTKMIFPRPGTYEVSAIVHVFDWPSNPIHRLTIESSPIVVTVTR